MSSSTGVELFTETSDFSLPHSGNHQAEKEHTFFAICTEQTERDRSGECENVSQFVHTETMKWKLHVVDKVASCRAQFRLVPTHMQLRRCRK